MPKNQNTAGKRARAAAKYTEALRAENEHHDGGQDAEDERLAQVTRELARAADPKLRASYLPNCFQQEGNPWTSSTMPRACPKWASRRSATCTAVRLRRTSPLTCESTTATRTSRPSCAP